VRELRGTKSKDPTRQIVTASFAFTIIVIRFFGAFVCVVILIYR